MMSRRSSGSPPVRIEQAVGREARHLVDDAQAGLGRQLAAVGEALVSHLGPRPGVEVAVLARQVAAVRQVPGDDVRVLERQPRPRYIPKKSLARSSTCSSTSREAVVARVSLDAGARHRADELGTFSSRSNAAAVQATVAARRPAAPCARSFPRTGISTRRPRPTGPIWTPSDCTSWVSIGLVSMAIRLAHSGHS